jgi:hypothetical protein
MHTCHEKIDATLLEESQILRFRPNKLEFARWT